MYHCHFELVAIIVEILGIHTKSSYILIRLVINNVVYFFYTLLFVAFLKYIINLQARARTRALARVYVVMLLVVICSMFTANLKKIGS
jgi:hypothetical protein